MNTTAAPNILLITSDQHHWMCMGYNNAEIKTPNLDRLAARGMIFDRAYCPNPTCTPTRASILTGMYPSQHGAHTLGTKLDETVPTMNDDWQKAGYKSALIGKAHFQPLASTDAYPSLESYPLLQDLDFWKSYDGPFYGFDHFELARNHTDEAHVGQHYAIWMESKGFKNWRKCYQQPTGTSEAQYGAWNIPEAFHYNTWISERTNAVIEDYAAKNQPFFIWSSYFDPHPPYIVPEPWASMYDPDALTLPQGREGEHETNTIFHKITQMEHPKLSDYGLDKGKWMHGVDSHLRSESEKRKDMAIYYGMISCMDHYIGKTLDKLDTLGLTDNTLVVFTSDHGHYFGQHNLIAKGPFHYEDGVRVPMIAAWPQQIQEGVRSDALQSLVDLPVSFLAAAGIEKPQQMTGLDQTAVWTGKQTKLRDWCIVENNHEPGVCEHKTYIEQDYKLTVFRTFDDGELYDLKNDPDEFENHFNDPAYAAIKMRLLQRFIQAEMTKEVIRMPRIAPA
ncbi:sulfatase-like hydrolase/transferase [Coraliomargarita sp. SDUM461004]|uniref:Sulfatase-like hydrolase/transferase n=1 Tax=Thalassobacterium sedimentorum TaxID=3041258 RepID=A0ABU1AKK1_9BACT|nr:sulfatase-like hydrolase/transferase [Coraliomargarita sp. SDUM461004]MDQ8195331.1 sulfatase-like hydrolase/transferase [Coraliomargarita sp. SDUM461004]